MIPAMIEAPAVRKKPIGARAYMLAKAPPMTATYPAAIDAWIIPDRLLRTMYVAPCMRSRQPIKKLDIVNNVPAHVDE